VRVAESLEQREGAAPARGRGRGWGRGCVRRRVQRQELYVGLLARSGSRCSAPATLMAEHDGPVMSLINIIPTKHHSESADEYRAW
jgi:hypothetical protein